MNRPPAVPSRPAAPLGAVTRRTAILLRTHLPLVAGMLLAVFLPLSVIRLALVSAGLPGVAIGVTVLGHLVLAWLLARRRAALQLDGLILRTSVLVPVLAGLILVEILVARVADIIVGSSDVGIVLGGLIGTLVVAPIWSLLLAARLAA